MNSGSILRVAVNAPLSRLFDYLAPTSGQAAPGCRVRVPFGRQTQIGMVMAVADKSDLAADKLKQAKEVLDESPLLSDRDLWLIQFTSDYYHHPIGEVVASALPALLRQGKRRDSIVRKIAITRLGVDTDIHTLRKRARRQADLLMLLRDAEQLSFSELDEAMREVGFNDVAVWRHTFDQKQWPKSVFLGPVDQLADIELWIAYVVGIP